MLGLPSNVFKGVIVTFKRSEAFGFIRSCQVSGDVYVHTEHMDREVKKGSDLVGKTVLFTVKDAGRKSLDPGMLCWLLSLFLCQWFVEGLLLGMVEWGRGA